MNTGTISRTIAEAAKLNLKYHVVSKNEINSFSNKKDAEANFKFGKRVIENSSEGGNIKLYTQEEIERMLK